MRQLPVRYPAAKKTSNISHATNGIKRALNHQGGCIVQLTHQDISIFAYTHIKENGRKGGSLRLVLKVNSLYYFPDVRMC